MLGGALHLPSHLPFSKYTHSLCQLVINNTPAFTKRTAHSSVGTPLPSAIELIHILAATGFPVSLRTSTAHSISSQKLKYYQIKTDYNLKIF